MARRAPPQMHLPVGGQEVVIRPAADAVPVPDLGLDGATWVHKVPRHFAAARTAERFGSKVGTSMPITVIRGTDASSLIGRTAREFLPCPRDAARRGLPTPSLTGTQVPLVQNSQFRGRCAEPPVVRVRKRVQAVFQAVPDRADNGSSGAAFRGGMPSVEGSFRWNEEPS